MTHSESFRDVERTYVMQTEEEARRAMIDARSAGLHAWRTKLDDGQWRYLHIVTVELIEE